MDFHGFSVDFNGFQWILMDFNGFLLESNGFLMDFNAFQWITMDFTEFQPPHGSSLRELGLALLPTFGSPAALGGGCDPPAWLRSARRRAGRAGQRRLRRWIADCYSKLVKTDPPFLWISMDLNGFQ